jgi:hypothetical protein
MTKQIHLLLIPYSSTVDYIITNLNPESLRMFTVSPLTPLLDHSKITAYLNRAILNHEASKLNKLYTTEKRYRQKESSSETYQQQIQSLLDNLLDKTFHCNSEGVSFIFDLSTSLSHPRNVKQTT